VSVYGLDVNGGSLNACAPIVALAVGPSHNILSDITVTGASLTFGYPMALQQPNVSWTDGNLVRKWKETVHVVVTLSLEYCRN